MDEAIECRFDGGEDFFEGVVAAHNVDGTYNIRYDDGDVEEGVPEALIRTVEEHSGDDDDDEEEEEEEEDDDEASVLEDAEEFVQESLSSLLGMPLGEADRAMTHDGDGDDNGGVFGSGDADRARVDSASTDPDFDDDFDEPSTSGVTAANKAEAERVAAEKADLERLAAEKDFKPERLVAEEAEAAEQQLAAERADVERLLAVEEAEAERVAAEKAEAERLAVEKAEAERVAAEKAEAERIAVEKAEAERIAAEKAKAERIAAASAEPEQLADADAVVPAEAATSVHDVDGELSLEALLALDDEAVEISEADSSALLLELEDELDPRAADGGEGGGAASGRLQHVHFRLFASLLRPQVRHTT